MLDNALRWLWQTSIIARGAVTAIALVAIFLPVMGWERQSFLEFTHALVAHWDYWLNALLSPVFNMLPSVMRLSERGQTFLIISLLLLPFFVFNTLYHFNLGNRVAAVMYSVLLLLLVATPWIEEHRLFTNYYLSKSWNAERIVLAFGVLIVVLVELLNQNQPLKRTYARSIIFMIAFLIVLEVFYHVPAITKMAEAFVEEGRKLEAQRVLRDISDVQ